MLICFSIEDLNARLMESSLEELSLLFIENFCRLGRYASRIDVGSETLIYGSQTLSGILLDYVNALNSLRKGQFHELSIDNNPIANVRVLGDQIELNFGSNRNGESKRFVVPAIQFENQLTEAVYRITFGIYMIDIAELSRDSIPL